MLVLKYWDIYIYIYIYKSLYYLIEVSSYSEDLKNVAVV